MSNQLTTARPTALAVPENKSPWRTAANEEAGASFETLLKFVKGDWLVGEERTKVAPSAMFVVNMQEYWRGWVKWVDKQPTEYLIGRVVDRHRVHLREELGDLDQSRWESDSSGVKRDPWQRVIYLIMRDAESDNFITFTTTSDGGRKAVGKLCDRFDRLRNKHPAQMPVVTLASESYQHKEYHKVIKPKFNVVGWDFWDDAARAGGTLQQQQHDAEMDDEIPF